jgi:glycosyltransferase involved in cell wall biosynthesis
VFDENTGKPKHVVFCLPVLRQPYECCVESLKASLPLIEAAGYTHGLAQIVDNPYISAARATMLRAALDDRADIVVFIDYDLSWRPQDLLKLIQTEGPVVGGTYRAKHEPVHYMGTVETFPDHRPMCRASDGAIKAALVPAGFLKVTKEAMDAYMVAYPELCYGPMYHLSVDLFSHGVFERVWWGEDYSFCRRWREKCGDIWLVPDLSLDHHKDGKVYAGNYHEYLTAQYGHDQLAMAAD